MLQEKYAPDAVTYPVWADYLTGGSKLAALSELHSLLGQSGVSAVYTLLETSNTDDSKPKFIILPAMTDKDKRRRVRARSLL